MDAWRTSFAGIDTVEVIADDFFERDADAMVSPANSFGVMDGGLDAAIADAIGGDIQARVREAIITRHHGELPVGCADIVPTANARWPNLILAPTMRVPSQIGDTVNAYLAFRALLLAVVRFNSATVTPIRTLVVPGLGTGIGCMPPTRCAHQMRIAFDQARAPATRFRNGVILQTHRELLSS